MEGPPPDGDSHHECYVCGVKKVVLEDEADLQYPPFLSCDMCGQTFCEDCQSVILCKEKFWGNAGQCFCIPCGETIPTEHREETEPKTPEPKTPEPKTPLKKKRVRALMFDPLILS